MTADAPVPLLAALGGLDVALAWGLALVVWRVAPHRPLNRALASLLAIEGARNPWWPPTSCPGPPATPRWWPST